MISKTGAYLATEFFYTVWIGKKVPCRCSAAHSDACDDDLKFARLFIVNARDESVVMIDRRILGLEIERPLVVQRILTVEDPIRFSIRTCEVKSKRCKSA